MHLTVYSEEKLQSCLKFQKSQNHFNKANSVCLQRVSEASGRFYEAVLRSLSDLKYIFLILLKISLQKDPLKMGLHLSQTQEEKPTPKKQGNVCVGVNNLSQIYSFVNAGIELKTKLRIHCGKYGGLIGK